MVTSVWIACPLTQTRWHKVTKTWRSQSNKIWLVCIMCILCEKEGTNKALKTVHFHSRLSVEHSGETESYNRRTTYSRWALTRRNCFLENSITTCGSGVVNQGRALEDVCQLELSVEEAWWLPVVVSSVWMVRCFLVTVEVVTATDCGLTVKMCVKKQT